MFGISLPELLVIMGVILIVFGPEKIPEIASLIGRATGELRRASDSVRREFYNSVYPPPPEIDRRETHRTLAAHTPTKEETQEKRGTEEPKDGE
jgi:TatA/E family protein of Tat protein translocase